MTLIQTFFSYERVIQVADRRLTWKDGTVADDEYTKLVCWNQTFAAGFTGISRVDRRGRKPTSEWIAEVLCDFGRFENGVQALAQETQNRVSKLNWPEKRLAIVVAGFDFRGPHIAEISNFNTSTNTSDDLNSFRIRTGHLRPHPHANQVHSVGVPLKDFESRLLRERVPRVLRRKDGLNRAIKLMVENQRRVHRYKGDVAGLVGCDAQVITIPRIQDGGPRGVVMSNMDGTDLSPRSSGFVYFDRKGFQYKQIGPLSASGGFVIDSLLGEANPDSPDDMSISWRYVKTPPAWQRRRAARDSRRGSRSDST